LGSARSTWSEEGEETPVLSTPPVVSRQRSSSLAHNRRWTLATAITSDEITDEMFVDQVERMRTKGTFLEVPESNVGEYFNSPTLNPSLRILTDPLLSATWQTARRALLICRELIRTERNYLALLLVLVSNGTAAPAPPSMLVYTTALIRASEELLSKMAANPSAQGVAEAFIESQLILEPAFVAWCGVSGGFFAGGDSQTRRNRANSSGVLREVDSPVRVPLKRRVTTWVQNRRNSSVLSRENTPAFPSGNPPRGARSLPTVRDLAILPVQRVMRYTLLFRGESDNPSLLPRLSSLLTFSQIFCNTFL
jgi:hypothetical protein